MTVLEILNRVLRRLREDEVGTLDESEYSSMLTEMLSEIHQECLEYDWSAMRYTLEVPLDAAQRVVNLTQNETDGGDITDATGVVTTSDSFLLYDDNDRPQAWIFDDSSDTDGDQLILVSEAQINQFFQLDRDETSEDATYFALKGNASRDGFDMVVWPVTEAARHIRIRFWIPEAAIESGSDDNRTVLVPWRPLYLGAIYLALNERGEEMGEPGGVAERRYMSAKGAAQESDLNIKGRTDQMEMRRD